MRRIALALVLTLLPALAAAQTLYVKPSDAGYLNLRAGPGTMHAVLLRMPVGQRVAVLEELGRWARVRLPSGEEGWASVELLEQGDRPAGDVMFVDVTGVGFLNLRAGPGTRFDIIRRMQPGDSVATLETRGDWLRVRHASGDTGWAHGDYLTR
ncbi:SH3 domain-containing protein [Jannaschia ovalis]|uniref:SH3 domain-containing protein n=1 Tax=Jannaschia ovalis TaxID=3038773 RepID=A0ABY8LCF5_9RHOB|nr:SH3 domain-containing protein [Jannaschia sp. GRR-S6-38]WGH78302.1 SH3 domain-containing protein [Jannaschia sp. GRR-S6-38]